MHPARLAGSATLLALLAQTAWQPALAKPQEFQRTVCSFWFKGNPVASRQCRVGRQQNRVFSINYLADIPPGEVKEETVTAGQNKWQYGAKPECREYPSTGYTICAK